MDKRKRRHFDVRFVIGLLIIAAGVVLLLDRMGVEMDFRVWDFWPVLLIVPGLGKLIQSKPHRSIFWGLILTGVGTLFLLNNLGHIDFWFDDLWAVLLIIIGFGIIKGGFLCGRRVRAYCISQNGKEKVQIDPECCSHGFSGSHSVDGDYINISTVLGGGEYTFTNQKLKGGKASAVMGGCELDLRNAEMEEDSMVLETNAVMGSVELRIPTHWEVVMRGVPILGAVEDKTRSQNPVKKLIIKGCAVMGSIELTN